jgi:phosphoglycerate dehydrogenase-like enzyme
LIQRLGSLTHDIDLEAAQAAGVLVAAWSVQVAIMVAEHMVLQMLALAKRLTRWRPLPTRPATGIGPPSATHLIG